MSPCEASRSDRVPGAVRTARQARDRLPTIAVGLITEAAQAEEIVVAGQADAVALARAMLYDPRWPWHAAAQLGARVSAPKPCSAQPAREFKDLFEGASTGQR